MILSKYSGNRMKGYIYTLEAVIAISIVLISVVVILSSQKAPAPLSAAIVKQQGIEALEFLDEKGVLRGNVLTGDVPQIKSDLRALLPPAISLDATICDVQCSLVLPVSGKAVVTADYYVAVYRDTFINKKVRVWMWGDFS